MQKGLQTYRYKYIVSDFGDLILENHNQMVLRKIPGFWKLAHLKNQFVKEELIGQIRPSFKLKDNENTEIWGIKLKQGLEGNG